MGKRTNKANQLIAQFGSNAKYVVLEVIDAIKTTTGHLTISKALERQEVLDDLNYWRDIKTEIERLQS